MKPKSIQNLEERMGAVEPGSFRYKVLDSAKNFKNSWIQLGQYLFSVYKDKLYKDWGYLTFDAYCLKEIGIRPLTAVKLLKSYYFLEKEEPAYMKNEAMQERRPSQIPSVDAVNTLRLAKASEHVPDREYQELRDQVLEDGKEDAEVKKKIRYILKVNKPKPSEEDKEENKEKLFKRLSAQLESAKNEMVLVGAPNKIIKKIEELQELLG